MSTKPTNNKKQGAATKGAPENAKGDNALQILLLGILVSICLLFVLQQFGIKSVYRSDTTARIDHNSAEYQNRAMPKRRAAEANPVVEQTMQELAQEFEGSAFSNISSANEQKGWGLSDDQAQYYDKIRTKVQQTGQNDQNWLNRIRAANSIYQRVQTLLNGADMKALAQPSRQSDSFFNELQKQFHVSVADSRNFAPRAQSVSDWAAFVEQRQH